MVEDYSSKASLRHVAEKLHSLIAEPYRWQDALLEMSASIGIATPDWRQVQDSHDLLRAADNAMYEAKRAGLLCSFADTSLNP